MPKKLDNAKKKQMRNHLPYCSFVYHVKKKTQKEDLSAIISTP